MQVCFICGKVLAVNKFTIIAFLAPTVVTIRVNSKSETHPLQPKKAKLYNVFTVKALDKIPHIAH